MLKLKDTIQARILRALAVLVIAVAALGGLSFFAIQQAQDSFRATIEDLNTNRDSFVDLRLSLEQTISSLEMIGASKGETGLQHLENSRKAKAAFFNAVDAIIANNPGRPWLSALEPIKTMFEEADTAGREIALALLEGKTTISEEKKNTLTKRFARLRSSLASLHDAIGKHRESELLALFHYLMLLIAPVAVLTLLVPTASVWFATKKINLELTDFVRDLHSFSEQNDQTSETLREASEALSNASGEQSAAVQETVASITEIRSMLAQTVSHVREVQSLTATVNEKTNDGRQIMTRMEASMLAIEQANAQLQSFAEIIRSIRGKTQVINDIVFKTQLLSFNASIEAARAGQYGRGFAVVAEEVGKLAQMSGNASKEIDQLLSDSQSRVVKIVEAVEERVSDGKNVSGDALKRFNEIAKQIAVISDKVNQVGEASVEQAGGVEQTASAMDQMNASALNNNKGAEQIFKIADKVHQLSAKIRAVTDGIRRYVREEAKAMSAQQHPDGLSVAATPLSTRKGTSTDDTVVRLVNRLAQKQATAAPAKLNDMTAVSADDPSFRKPSGRG